MSAFMETLKERLLMEQERMERIMEKAKGRLRNAPEGTLRLSSCRKTVQYYHCLPGGEKNGTYIPKEQMELVRSLAQKSYDEKVMRLAGKRLAQLRKLTKDYEDDEIAQVYQREHPQRQKLLDPVEPTWEQKIEQWSAKEYQGKEFQEGTGVILTQQGERVRSKSEKILADYFYQKNIPYKYEKPLNLKGFGMVYPDFTFLSRKTEHEIYWEHDGKMDDPVYARNAVRKIQAYEENGIYPGERLILTFETEKTVLDIRMVKRLVERYLL